MTRKRVCIRNNRSDNDSEDELEESVILQMSVEGSSVRKTRGFTRMADVWNLPPHSLIVVTFNKVHQPVGVEGTVLKRFIGSMSKFEIPNDRREILKKKLIRSMGDKWRNWKCSLREKYYSETKSIAQVIGLPPERVEIPQWSEIVLFWYSKDGQKRSAIGKANRSKQTTAHTAGTKSYAQHAYEMAMLEELMSQCSDNSNGGSGGSIIWDKNDIYSQVVGKDKYGYFRGLGFSPTPSMKDSVTCACHGTRINTQERLEDQEAMREMREKIKMLEAQVATLVSMLNQNSFVPVSFFTTS
ncbi:uncharacterized protein G2W53_021965 [Senna tora]|uniref:Transposase n=1 Tax=Senna tora TaxID=362788 RepID=A0A834WLK7_9FABA|nr:uncharacterized protein G2W53_021965 [Senna tora]